MRSAALLVVAVAAASCASARPSGPVADDAAKFERLKSLAGTWTAKDNPAMKVVYRVTAGDSAVHETEFGGSPQEMVTVYTLDHGRLVLTHYCMLGNQPHMALQPSSTADNLVFDLTSLGGGDASKDTHMHHAEITLTDADHLTSKWTLWDAGKPGETHGFVLERARN
jgi:hypothetical protein